MVVDLAKCVDRVNHDILNGRLKTRIDDAGVIRLVRAYMNTGTVDGAVVVERHCPHCGPTCCLTLWARSGGRSASHRRHFSCLDVRQRTERKGRST